MTTFTLNPGEVSAQDKTLAASTVDIVNFPQPIELVKVTTDGSADVFVTVDGSTPTVDGAHTYKIPATPLQFAGGARDASSRILEFGGKQVQLISAGTPKYSVEHANPADT